MREEWRPVVGYEGLYEVSNMGRVKSLGNGKSTNSNNCRERILKAKKNSKGYLHVYLYKDGKRKDYKIHRLVATAFCENPMGYNEVNHIDEDKTNNCADNLEWCSRSYNNTYNDRAKKVGKKNTNNPKLSKPVIGIDVRTGLIVGFPSIMEASRQLGIGNGNLCACCQGKLNSCGGFYWMYANTDDDTE